ncbi:tetraspanin-9-like [Mizuhopecten yessoensis]|uniref:tetraspanin-9-like n=1 Tax=Mizuhopecten yessoensis TaxID=6573 RepID=UPI000B45EC21|nr:tetraspanin-9-like [Mizuhopecten yessoensis]
MGACSGCGQIILVLINLLFALVGILLLTVGCIVKWGESIMDDVLSDWYNNFRKALEEAGVDNSSIANFNIEEFLQDAAIAFIVIGAFFFLLGIIGCLGACCKVRALLICYSIIIVMVILVELTFVILLFAIREEVDGWLKEPLQTAIANDYTGTNGTDAVTLGLNFIMSEFECCGVETYSEFNNTAKKWQKLLPNQIIPLICCRNASRTNYDCLTSPTTNNSFSDKGCYSAIEDWVDDNADILIGSGAAVAAVEILLVLFACVVCAKNKSSQKRGYEAY